MGLARHIVFLCGKSNTWQAQVM